LQDKGLGGAERVDKARRSSSMTTTRPATSTTRRRQVRWTSALKLADFLGDDFRLKWWRDLEANQPEAARRMVEKWPDRYPIKKREGVREQ